jgi:hypothetical protein
VDEHEEFERLLHRELQAREAPAGFSARVMALLPQTPPAAIPQTTQRFWLPALRWTAAALALMGIAGGGYWEHQRRERIAGERARGQVILALHISAATLHDVLHKVVKVTKGDTE